MGALEDQVHGIQAVVDRLEARIKKLEEGKFGGVSHSKLNEDVRMILIGPPGAGMFNLEITYNKVSES